MDYRILGPLQAVVGDTAVHLGGPQQRAVLAILLLRRNQVVPLDVLIDDIWADAPPPTAAQTVRVYVSRLRQALAPGYSDPQPLQTLPGGYRLTMRREQLDSARFELLFDDGCRLLDRGDAAGAVAVLREALALWRGPPLADLMYEPLAQATVSTLEEMHMAAIERHLEAEIALGNLERLIPALNGLVHQHPLRERLHGLLILALYRAGREADAMAAYRAARRIFNEELGVDPGAALTRVARPVLAPDAPADVDGGRADLPVPPTKLIGRGPELAAVGRLMQRPEARLVTIAGVGGSGKTRLAIELARQLSGRYADGVYFIDLAPLAGADGVLPLTARTVGVKERSGEKLVDRLVERLSRMDALLVLDNFEHVLGAAAELAAILARCPRLTAMVTSRATLRVSGEEVYRLAPLAPPNAVELFIERARSAQPGLRVSQQDLAVVDQICARLDGLPLAVELAASLVRLLPLEELQARLDRRLATLVRDARDGPDRHHALRASLDWSYDLLDRRDRDLLPRLAVFAGGCSLEAAEQVCDADLLTLTNLTEHGLLRCQIVGGRARFTMLETVHEYAAERLEATGDGERIRDRHARHYLELMARHVPALDTSAGRAGLVRLDLEHENVRAALDWARRRGHTELALALATQAAPYWSFRGYTADGAERLRAALEGADPATPAAASAQLAAAELAHETGDSAWERSLLEACLATFRRLRDAGGVAGATLRLARLAVLGADREGARRYLNAAARAVDRADSPHLSARAQVQRGQLSLYSGRLRPARRLLHDGYRRYRALDSCTGAAWALKQIGLVTLAQGRRRRARALIVHSLRMLHGTGWTTGTIGDGALEALAAADLTTDPVRAARLLGAAMVLRRRGGMSLAIPWEHRLHDQTVAGIRAEIGHRRFTQAWRSGRAMSFDEAVEYAMAAPSPAVPGLG